VPILGYPVVHTVKTGAHITLNTTKRSIWKMLGPFATASRRTPIHQVSLLSHARIDVHDDDNDNDNDNDNAWERGRYGPIEWAQMGPIMLQRMRLKMTLLLPKTTLYCCAVLRLVHPFARWLPSMKQLLQSNISLICSHQTRAHQLISSNLLHPHNRYAC